MLTVKKSWGCRIRIGCGSGFGSENWLRPKSSRLFPLQRPTPVQKFMKVVEKTPLKVEATTLATFPYCDVELWLWRSNLISTVSRWTEFQLSKSKVLMFLVRTYTRSTHPTDCSFWTTKVVGNHSITSWAIMSHKPQRLHYLYRRDNRENIVTASCECD